MGASWFTVHEMASCENGLMAAVSVPENVFWFDGHFPENPILPAVAQIALAVAVVEKMVDRPIRVSGLRRVRFKKIMRPGDVLRITVTRALRKATPGSAGYEFRCSHDGEAVCAGSFTCEAMEEISRGIDSNGGTQP